VPDDGLCCKEPPLDRRLASVCKLLADTDLPPPSDVFGCKPPGVVAGDSLGVEPPDKLSALLLEGLLAGLALTGLVKGLGNDDGREGVSTALPGRLAAPSEGTVGSFLPLPGFKAEVFALGTLCLVACSFNDDHRSFSSSSFLRFLSSNAALRSSFFLLLSSACCSRRSFTLLCL